MLQQNETIPAEAVSQWPQMEIEQLSDISESRLTPETEQAVRHLSSIYH